jgi:histidinol-phosphatase (PHP family)
MMARVPFADYHVHTPFSDGHDDVDACCAQAVSLGLTELGISDHVAPVSLTRATEYALDHRCLGEYVGAVRDAAARHPSVRLLCGVEVDFAPGLQQEITDLLGAHAFDYRLCSVHFTDGFQFNATAHRHDPGWDRPELVFRRYWELVCEAVATGLFDVLAHPDLPKRWGYRHDADLTALEDEAIAALRETGTAIEVNTSGLRHPAHELYPAPGLLARARDAGVAIIFGSDAHHAADVSAGMRQALVLARAAGYTSWLRLSDRRPVPLPE